MKKNNKIKALGLMSGGLDSVLAVKLMIGQGIDVTGIHFMLPFAGPDDKGGKFAKHAAESLGIELRLELMGEDYLDVIKHPKHGWGSGINPCIDCKIYMLSRTKEIADEIGAEFVFTGEVLGQRPMSQHRRALGILERESGLSGRLLRPLSAGYLKETIPEQKGWVKREELPAIYGRNREMQYELAKKYNIEYFAPVAGGCLLTDKLFAKKMRDILKKTDDFTWNDVLILKEGRHFRFNDNKIIVGRNEKENGNLWKLKRDDDMIFELPEEIPGPTVMLQGEKNDDAIHLAAALALRYSDLEQPEAEVCYGKNTLDKFIKGSLAVLDEVEYYNVTLK